MNDAVPPTRCPRFSPRSHRRICGALQQMFIHTLNGGALAGSCVPHLYSSSTRPSQPHLFLRRTCRFPSLALPQPVLERRISADPPPSLTLGAPTELASLPCFPLSLFCSQLSREMADHWASDFDAIVRVSEANQARRRQEGERKDTLPRLRRTDAHLCSPRRGGTDVGPHSSPHLRASRQGRGGPTRRPGARVFGHLAERPVQEGGGRSTPPRVTSSRGWVRRSTCAMPHDWRKRD